MSTPTPSSTRILAVDPGYERLGIAILEQNVSEGESLIYSSCFTTPKDREFNERLRMLGCEIDRLISEFAPQALALETLFFTKNQKTAMLVAEARGVILYEATKHSLPIYEYSPLQIKTAVTGYGKSDKDQVTTMVKQLIGVEKEIQHDDEYDAIAVGLTCFAIEKLRK
mgnify:CR=1 FL=1